MATEEFKSSLESALKNSWSLETTFDPKNWSPENPAWGQCAVTALVVSDYLGGDLVWSSALLPNGEEVLHFYNKVDGTDLDYTRSQFPEGTPIREDEPKNEEFRTTREYILSYPATRRRYNLLREYVDDFLRHRG